MVSGISSIFILDGFSLFVGIFVVFFTVIIFIYSLGFIKNKKLGYYIWFFATFFASLGVVFSRNVWLLIIFWGFLGLSLFELINLFPSDRTSFVAKKTFIIVGGSDGLMLLGFIIYMYLTYHRTTVNFSLNAYNLSINNGLALLSFVLIAIGCFAKAGAMPFHAWVPEVATEAEVPVVAYLPASLDKLLGIYLLARIVKDSFVLNNTARIILLVIGAITVFGPGMMALVQHNVKKLLGYCAVSQVGYMVLGIGCATPLGIGAGLFHMLNHAIYKSCLFLGAGNVEYQTKTSELKELGGLGKYMPVTFIVMLIAGFSVSGIPPFNGFVSKWLVYQGLIDSFGDTSSFLLKIVVAFSLIAALIGSGLTLASFLKLLSGVFLGRNRKKTKEVGMLLYFPPLILAFLCIVYGVFFNSTAIKFIIGSVGSFPVKGLFSSVLATNLILFGILLGAVFFTVSSGKIRTTEVYLGGEELEDNLKGEDFYDSIRRLPLIEGIYDRAERKVFDIYEDGKKLVFACMRFLRYLHNGVLPTYLVWCLLGVLGLFFIFLK